MAVFRDIPQGLFDLETLGWSEDELRLMEAHLGQRFTRPSAECRKLILAKLAEAGHLVLIPSPRIIITADSGDDPVGTGLLDALTTVRPPGGNSWANN